MGISEIMGLFGNFGVLVGLLAIVAIVLYLAPIPLWIAAWASGLRAAAVGGQGPHQAKLREVLHPHR